MSLDLAHLPKDPYRLNAKNPPKFRGKLHMAMLVPAIVGGVWLGLRAPSPGYAVISAIYSYSVFQMFLLSSLFHLKHWSDRTWWRLRQTDHTSILLLIAGSYLAIAGIGLEGWVRIGILSFVGAGTLFAILYRWLPIVPKDGVTNTTFLVLGWSTVVASGWLIARLGVLGFIVLLTGGVFFTLGAMVLGFRWPNPSLRYFGYHEIWHVATIVGVVCHFVVVAFFIF